MSVDQNVDYKVTIRALDDKELRDSTNCVLELHASNYEFLVVIAELILQATQGTITSVTRDGVPSDPETGDPLQLH